MTDQRDRTLAGPRPAVPRLIVPLTVPPSAPPGTAPAPVPAGPRRWPVSFADRRTGRHPRPGVRAVVRLVRECAVRPPGHTLADLPLLPVAPGPVPQAGSGTVSVTWAGHASWVIGIGGLTVLTDPVWSARIPGTPRRITPVGVALAGPAAGRRGRHQPQPLRPPRRADPQAPPADDPLLRPGRARRDGSGAAASCG